MSFSINDSKVALCNNERVVIYDLDDSTENTILLPELETDKKINVHNNASIETFHMITNVSFSNDGKYFLVCTNRKQLCLYESKSQKLLSNRTLVRAASKVVFAPNNGIIVADKAGDAYLFSTNKSTENGVLLLGHLSMLLDVLITEDEKYIITADRDEKIRVSMFPNSYNILSYCLGHSKFVTNISELPHDKRILVSSGGDGVFMLWDYKSGQDLMSIDFREKISKKDIDKFNRYLQDYHLEESVEILPVKFMRLSLHGSTASLVVMSFYDSPLLLIYKVCGTLETGLEAKYLQSIALDNEPIECLPCKQNLWILMESGFKIYEFKDNSFIPNNELDSKVKELNSIWHTLKKNIFKQDLFPILYKRKYDNVQEYLERKKTRLGNTME